MKDLYLTEYQFKALKELGHLIVKLSGQTFVEVDTTGKILGSESPDYRINEKVELRKF